MIEEVFILGQIGKAFYEQDDRYFVVELEESSDTTDERSGEPLECRAGDVALFFDSGAEYSVLSGGDISLDTIRNTLESSSQAYDALTMCLSGLNSELSPRSRQLSVEAAEELLQVAHAHAFVRARLLARPLPEVADIDGALKYAADAEALTVFTLYEEVRKSQKAIGFLNESWSEVGVEFFPQSREEAAQAEGILIESGVFAEMIAAASARETNRLGSIVVAYGMKPELKRALPRCVQILNAVRTHLQHKMEQESSKRTRRIWQNEREEDEAVEIEGAASIQTDEQRSELFSDLIAAFDKRDRDWRPSKGFEVEEQINNQIASIGKHIRKGDLERAHVFLYSLLEFQLKHSLKDHTAMSLCALAKTAMDSSAFEMANELVGYAFALKVEDVVIWTTQAEILKATGQIDAALDAYEEAMERFPDNAPARSGYAEALKAKGDFDAALRVYEQTMGRFPDDVVARTGYAEALKAKGGFDAALKAYEEAIRRFPDNVVARSGYAEALKAKGDFDAALKIYKETIGRFPDNVVARTGYAEVLKAKGDFDAALKAYEETMERFPDDVIARNGYAEALKAKGDFGAALEVYEQTMERFPDDVVARSGYAEALKAKGDFGAALEVYEQTMERFPDNAPARNGCASLLVIMKDFHKAELLLSYLSGIRLVTKDHWIGHHILAMSFLKRGDLDEAIRRLEYGLKNTQWIEQRHYYVTALGLARMRRKEYGRAIEILKDNVVSLDVFQRQKRFAFIGHAQAKSGQKSAALSTLAQVTNAGGPLVYHLKGDLIHCYGLDPHKPQSLTRREMVRLERKIDDEEDQLAMAA